MRVAVCYVYPLVNNRTYYPLALRFGQSYKLFPSGYPHELHVLFNGGKPSEAQVKPLEGIDYRPHYYDNSGWDIGAFQSAAEEVTCDLLVCLGAPVHFHRSEWLRYMVESYIANGPALYGCWCYNLPLHVRTTAFWLPPVLLLTYPRQVGSSRSARYDFEHGNNSLTRFILSAGMECLLVTTGGVFPISQWESRAPGVDNSLLLDQHTHK